MPIQIQIKKNPMPIQSLIKEILIQIPMKKINIIDSDSDSDSFRCTYVKNTITSEYESVWIQTNSDLDSDEFRFRFRQIQIQIQIQTLSDVLM